MQTKKREIGLFFGSFNPIHIGHTAIANYVAEFSDVKEVWFVVTPQNPWKKSSNLLPDRQRHYLTELAIDKHYNYKVSDIEFNLPKPNYTVNTLEHLKEKFPKKVFSLIIGGDNLQHFHKWKNYETILKNHKIYVYKRQNFIEKIPEELLNIGNIEILNAPVIEISSTFIRESIKQEKDMSFFLHKKVYRYILDNWFYQKK